MLGLRTMSPGGYEYLTGSVACGDRELDAGESLAAYYTAHGYPPGQWFGAGAAALGLSGEVTAEQMAALFGEGRRPDADQVEAELIAAGASPEEAMRATQLGRAFPQYGGGGLQRRVAAAYRAHNQQQGRAADAPIDDDTRAEIRRRVQTRAYADAHGGRQPTGQELARWLAELQARQKSATSGYELVLAPPKSVSVAWALVDPHTRVLIAGLHRQAVHDTLTYFERQVAFTRKGAGGLAQHDVRGITAAVFEHWDSRAGDPHLHTHVPISAKVQGPDGTWTSLDGRTIHAAAVTMSEYYNSRIRDGLRAHGATLTQRPHQGVDAKRPVWELDGIPNDLIAGFSQRAQQVEEDRARRIVAFRRQHGREPDPKEVLAIGRLAQYGTRSGKQVPRSLSEHVTRWRGQAGEMVEAAVLDQLPARVFGGAEALAAVDVTDLAEKTVAVVSDHYAHFTLWNLEAEAHRQSAHLRVDNRDAVVSSIVTSVVNDADTVSLQPPATVDEPPSLRRRSGESVFLPHRAQRYTTLATLRAEEAMLAWGRRHDGHYLHHDTVSRALHGAGLNTGQRRMVTSFARSGRRLQLALAPAGAGKTTAMHTFAQAWRAAGGQVYAFAPSAKAAKVLGAAVDARPHTLHQLTQAQRMGVEEQAFPFTRGDVLLIDEVSLAGTHTLHAVVDYALRRGADVRLIGDDKQLAAVEAGGFTRLFAHDIGAVRLRQVVRFADENQAHASLHLHDGNPVGLDYYLNQGWVHGGSRESMRDAAYRGWYADLTAGRQTLLIVPTNEDVTALNRQARQLRIDRGLVHAHTRTAQLHDGTHASRGDWVVTRANDRLQHLFGGRDFVKNGDVWTVRRVRRDGALTVRNREHGGTLTLPADYTAANVELAYAATVHRVQGMTSTGSAHGVVPQHLAREALYTLATRATQENQLYVVTHQHAIDSHQETPQERSARDVLETVLARSSAETSATDTLRQALATEESLATLVARYNHVARDGADHRIDHALTTHAPTLLHAPAAPALRQTLHTANDLGWQPDYLVLATMAQGSLQHAQDPAAVLQQRIATRITQHSPPPRQTTPTQQQITRWRTLFDDRAPQAGVENAEWMPLWRRAAAATTEGLDVDAALAAVASTLAARPTQDPTPEHHWATAALDTMLTRQRNAGGGWQPTLPWQARPDHAHLTDNPELADYLRRLDAAIATRTTELRNQVATDQPAWTRSLGPRPEDPATAARWDHLAGLAAAYRDTHGITTTDPATPLGEQPSSPGLQARGWHALTQQEMPPASDEVPAGSAAASSHSEALQPARSALDERHAALDLDAMLTAVAESDSLTTAGDQHDEPLSELLPRYQRTLAALHEHDIVARAQQALAERAPTALDAPATDALLHRLRDAEDTGWPAEDAIATITRHDLHHAHDPAAVLHSRLTHALRQHDPADTDHENSGADNTADTAQTLTGSGAIETTAPPTSALSAVPIVAEADPAALARHPELAVTLDQLRTAITERSTELRHDTANNPPDWTASLGPRPHDPTAAHRWDEVAGAAAAYRETYRVTTTNPATPLGPKPDRDGPRSHAWQQITDHWSTTMSSFGSSHQDRNQAAIDHLTARIHAGDHSTGDHTDRYLDDLEHQAATRAAETAEHDDEDRHYEDLDERRDEDLGTGLHY